VKKITKFVGTIFTALGRCIKMIIIQDQIISPILVQSLQELNVPVFKHGQCSEIVKSVNGMEATKFFSLLNDEQKLLIPQVLALHNSLSKKLEVGKIELSN